jgi:hypothetical protein
MLLSRLSGRRQLTITVLLWGLIFWPLPALQAAPPPAPLSIAGIRLGSDVSGYPEIVESNFLKEVVVTDWHGFRNGVISYGVCQYQNQILKIDMKYQERSEAFYKTLLSKFRDTFGPPHAWEGDSFGVMQVWKWRFTDQEENPVSLTLQYNSKDARETIGNMVKLSYPRKIEEERLCFVDMCARRMTEIEASRAEALRQTDWSYLIPR